MRLTTRGRIVVGILVSLTAIGAAFGLRALLGGTPEAIGAGGAASARASHPLPHIPRPAWRPATPASVDEPLAIITESRTNTVVERATRTLLRSAPVVVLAPSGNPAGMAAAERLGVRLHAPVLPVPGAGGGGAVEGSERASPADPSTATLLRDLGTRTVVAVGSARVPRGPHGVRRVPVPVDVGPIGDLIAQADGHGRTPPPERPAALVRRGDPAGSLVSSVARAARYEVIEMTGTDPRSDPDVQLRLAEGGTAGAVVLGTSGAWSDVDREALTWQVAVARRGLQLPGGGQVLFPGRRLVALYGNPEGPALGALGEQDAEAAVERAREVAEAYAATSEVPVIPTFEIIATVASRSSEPTSDWSRRSRRDTIERWVDVAEQAGVYVVLDLQPGTTDFLTQAREFEDLLVRPHVGLALDPEWRLSPGQRHLQQIGSVGAAEINQVAEYLAGLVRQHELPQKLLLVHQFRLSMIRDRAALDRGHPELALAIQMDGQGGQDVKLDSWRTITTTAPPDGLWWGWKNFYDEDPVVRSPADVLSLDPSPVFVSYQ